jgi:hypothetical protein
MDRQMLREHLQLAEKHVDEGEQHLRDQRRIVDELERDGHAKSAEKARELLATMEQTQALHLADRDRLRAQLDTI